jgi:hypothetical protein
MLLHKMTKAAAPHRGDDDSASIGDRHHSLQPRLSSIDGNIDHHSFLMFSHRKCFTTAVFVAGGTTVYLVGDWKEATVQLLFIFRKTEQVSSWIHHVHDETSLFGADDDGCLDGMRSSLWSSKYGIMQRYLGHLDNCMGI